jgi:hypothetical protein
MTGVDVRFSSISVVEPIPTLLIKVPKTPDGVTGVVVNGMPGTVAADIDWGELVNTAFGIGKKLFGNDGGKGGGGGCTTVKITNADGSSTSVTQCPAPAGGIA